MTPEKIREAAENYIEIPVLSGGKRCGIQWPPWMGDWFTSWSPRNGNSNAEGSWDHWVDLALKVLKDPLTAKVRPGAHAAVAAVPVMDFYDENGTDLDDEELVERFATKKETTNA